MDEYKNPGCYPCAQRGWGNSVPLPSLKTAADEKCPYCTLIYQGILQLIPDVEERFGFDARFGFRTESRIREQGEILVCSDSNGSFRDKPKPEHIRLDYEYYREDDDYNPGYRPTLDTWSDATFHQAEDWIWDCFRDHSLCGNDEPKPLPTRIIDTGEGREIEPQSIRLVESTWMMERYIALSHCWGGGEQQLTTTTTTATLDERKAGIEFASLPKTFQDAVRIVRRLGIRYLWIDSFCIIQDSSEDWQAESSRMATVYRNSWVTLSATRSTSSTSGCLNTNQSITLQHPPEEDDDDPLAVLFPDATKLRQNLRLYLCFSITHPDFGLYLHVSITDPEYAKTARFTGNKNLPLLNRAWAFQERLLAPRVLHFGPQELFWECTQGLDCECGDVKWARGKDMGGYMNRNTALELPPKISHYAALHVGGAKSSFDDTKRKTKLLARWADMVQEYTQRNLSFASDRLPAMAGLAGEMGERLSMTYCAGIWKESLPLGLLWEVAHMALIGRPINEPKIAPSWSWAEPNVEVSYGEFSSWPAPEWDFRAEVEDIQCVPVTEHNPFGQVRVNESYLILHAEMIRVWLYVENEDYDYDTSRWILVKDAIANKTKIKAPTQPDEQPYTVRTEEEDPDRGPPTNVKMDRRLCDDNGEWVIGADHELYCALVAVRERDYYRWLVLRRLLDREDSVYERIGVAASENEEWKVGEENRQRIKIV